MNPLNIKIGLVLALLTLSINAKAQTCSPASSSSATVSSNCTALSWTSGNVTVNSGVTVGAVGSSNAVTIGSGTVGTLTNSGTLAGGAYRAIYTDNNNPTVTSIVNTATGILTGDWGIYTFSGSVGSISNAGQFNAGTFGILNYLVTINTIENTGVIDSGYTALRNFGTITTLTNTGSMTGSFVDIQNYGTITTFNNGQGGNSASASTTALTLSSNLPSNYNIIISSPTHYGQLAVTSPSGATTFGIYSGSTVSKGTYSSVLSGITSSNLNNTSGNYNGYTWTLNNSSGNIWDLVFTGGPTADTQAALQNTASVLQNTFTLQNSVLANSFSYDCTQFGANGICVSAGGRNTAVSAANGLNNTSGLLIAAYRPHANYRVGAYVDQNLSVNNAGSTVNLGNNTPLLGLFGAWNERLDGTGTEVKVSAAYGQKNTTVTRQVVGTSEAGSGSSQLNSQGAQVAAKYGFGVADSTIVSPYVGIRYTQNNMGGYTEGSSGSVTAPLTYSALNTNATTVLAGVGASYKGIPQTTLFASAGVESDTNTQNGSINATGVSGLTPVNFNPNPVKTRPTAMVGAAYDVEKNQRLGVTGIYRQEPYQAVSTTTVMATYTVGL